MFILVKTENLLKKTLSHKTSFKIGDIAHKTLHKCAALIIVLKNFQKKCLHSVCWAKFELLYSMYGAKSAKLHFLCRANCPHVLSTHKKSHEDFAPDICRHVKRSDHGSTASIYLKLY